MNVVPGHDLRQLLHADLPIVVDVKKSKRLLYRTSWKHLSTFLCTKPWEGSGLSPGPPQSWPWITLSENNQSLCCADHLQCPLSSPSPFVLSATVTADFEVKPQLHVCHLVCSAPFNWTQLWSSPLISLCQKICLHDSMISSTYLIQVVRRVILFQPQEMKKIQVITLHQIPKCWKFSAECAGVIKHYVGSGAHQGLREIGNWFLLWRKPGRGWEEHENCTFFGTTNRAFPIFTTEKKKNMISSTTAPFQRTPLVGPLVLRYWTWGGVS